MRLHSLSPSPVPPPAPHLQDPACAGSLTRVAAQAAGGPDAELFADFVGAVLNDLVYLLKDSLGVGAGHAACWARWAGLLSLLV